VPWRTKKLPGPNDIPVDVRCGFCGQDTPVALKDIRPNDSFVCKKCHNSTYLSIERASEIKDRIGRRLDGLRRWTS
jgi:hypothetical protein